MNYQTKVNTSIRAS